MIQLQSTDFELFDVPPRFAQDGAVLDARWKALQREVHPDRFAAQGAAAQRVAAQWSARINEAHRRLKDPLRRAAYLCELRGAPIEARYTAVEAFKIAYLCERRGAPIEAERNTAMPPAFLMQQMALREQLDAARDAAELDAIEALAARMQRELLQEIEQQLDADRAWAAAAQSVRALMFLDKLAADIERRRDTLA